MPCFPQLSTGASGQYPIVRRRRTRTVVNRTLDGHDWKLGDADGAAIIWELYASALTDQEWAAIESLFQASEGRLQCFMFLDPADNLLAHSEDLTASEWQKDPLLQLTQSVADPLGTTRAISALNTGQAAQGISQSLSAPADYVYCVSLYARSAQPTDLTLRRFSASGLETETVSLSANWRRFLSSGSLGVAEQPVRFGFEIPPGASVDVFGLQVEAQPGASKYKRTLARGGIYPKARFSSDVLARRTDGPGRHSAAIRIFSSIEE